MRMAMMAITTKSSISVKADRMGCRMAASPNVLGGGTFFIHPYEKVRKESSQNSNFLLATCSSLGPGQNDLAAVARQHRVETLLELLPWKAMRDDRTNVEPRLQEHRHVIPRLIHLAAIDAFEGEHV